MPSSHSSRSCNGSSYGTMVDKESTATPTSPAPPTDKLNQVYWTILYVGLVGYLPWNILITVNGYWSYKFRDVTADQSDGGSGGGASQSAGGITPLQKEFTSYLSVASQVPNAVFVVLHALVGQHFGRQMRIVGSQVGTILTFSAITALAILDTDSWQESFLVSNLCLIALLNAFQAVFQGSFVGNVGKFPVRYMGAMVSGAGLGGLVPACANLAVLAVVSLGQGGFQLAGFVCFVLAAVLSVICLLLILRMQGLAFYRHYAGLDDDHTDPSEVKVNQVEAATETGGFDLSRELGTFREVFRSAWLYILAVAINFAVTLSVFPAVAVLIEPERPVPGSPWHDTYFVAVCCFVVYNAFDVAGKMAAARLKWPGRGGAGKAGKYGKQDQLILLALASARVALVPLIMFCNVSPSSRKTQVFFPSEYYYLVFLSLLAFTNGYVGNIGLMFGPKAARPHLQERTASVLVASLVIGLSLGSIISVPIVRAL